MRHNRTRFVWFPILIPSYPAIFIAARNVGEFRMGELLGILIILLAIGAGVHATSHVLLRHRKQPSNIALISTTLSGWLFVSTGVRQELLQHLAPAAAIPVPVGLLTTAVLTVLLVALILHQRGDLTGVSRPIGILVYTLVTLASLRLAVNEIVATYKVSRSSFIKSRVTLPADQHAPDGLKARAPQRDIYLMILDKYASSGVLREHFGYSAAPFEDELRRLGFLVPPNSRSNYAYTWQSLASMLNFEHITGASDSLGDAETLGLRFLIENNRTVEFMRRRGYRFYFFPSHMFVATQHDRRADVEFSEPVTRAPLRATVSRSQLAHTVWALSIPGVIGASLGFDIRYPERELEIFRELERVAPDPGPKFLLAHVMLTHEPFFFDGNCRLTGLVGRTEPDARAYIDQVQCTNKMLLGLITSILASSPIAPIILIQADHGIFTDEPIARPTDRAVIHHEHPGDRFRAFAAYYLPGGGAGEFDSRTTPVNLMRFVFDYYFGAHLPPRPNQSFQSGQHPELGR